MIPIAGSAYTYSYATMGEFFAWVIGWDLILEYCSLRPSVAVGWSGHVVAFLKDLGFIFPEKFCNAPVEFRRRHYVLTGAVINAPAMFIIFVLTILLIIGIKASANFNNVMVVTKVTVLLGGGSGSASGMC